MKTKITKLIDICKNVGKHPATSLITAIMYVYSSVIFYIAGPVWCSLIFALISILYFILFYHKVKYFYRVKKDILNHENINCI